MAGPSPPPVRNPAGATSAPPYGMFADCGYGDPTFYHQFYDDFDNSLGPAGLWTITAASGSVAQTPGDGGLALFTTGSVSAQFAEIQLPAANVTLPGTTTKKLFFAARFQLSDVLADVAIVGLCNTTATPFTAVADGVYFSKPNGSAVLNLITVVGGTATTWTIPTAFYTLANATNIDVGFMIDRYGTLKVFIGSQLYGYIPQSGTGAVSTVTGQSLLPVLGPALVIGYPNSTTWSQTSANLNPTAALQTQAAAAKTMTLDFIGVSKER